MLNLKGLTSSHLFLLAPVSIVLTMISMLFYIGAAQESGSTRTALNSAQVQRAKDEITASNESKYCLPETPEGKSVYLDETYGFAFFYPSTVNLQICESKNCGFISTSDISFQLLMPYYTQRDALLERDFYCDASGPTGSILCTNTELEDVTNGYGFSGVKIYRTKDSTHEGIAEDWVYVYVLPDKGTTKVPPEYAGVLFHTSNPTPENLALLDEIANTFIQP